MTIGDAFGNATKTYTKSYYEINEVGQAKVRYVLSRVADSTTVRSSQLFRCCIYRKEPAMITDPKELLLTVLHAKYALS